MNKFKKLLLILTTTIPVGLSVHMSTYAMKENNEFDINYKINNYNDDNINKSKEETEFQHNKLNDGVKLCNNNIKKDMEDEKQSNVNVKEKSKKDKQKNSINQNEINININNDNNIKNIYLTPAIDDIIRINTEDDKTNLINQSKKDGDAKNYLKNVSNNSYNYNKNEIVYIKKNNDSYNNSDSYNNKTKVDKQANWNIQKNNFKFENNVMNKIDNNQNNMKSIINAIPQNLKNQIACFLMYVEDLLSDDKVIKKIEQDFSQDLEFLRQYIFNLSEVVKNNSEVNDICQYMVKKLFEKMSEIIYSNIYTVLNQTLETDEVKHSLENIKDELVKTFIQIIRNSIIFIYNLNVNIDIFRIIEITLIELDKNNKMSTIQNCIENVYKRNCDIITPNDSLYKKDSYKQKLFKNTLNVFPELNIFMTDKEWVIILNYFYYEIFDILKMDIFRAIFERIKADYKNKELHEKLKTFHLIKKISK